MKKFLICLSPSLLTILLFLVLDIGSGNRYGTVGEWFIPLAFILVGLGAFLSAIFLGRAVYRTLKSPDWSRVLLGELVGFVIVPVYVLLSFGGCAAVSSILD